MSWGLKSMLGNNCILPHPHPSYSILPRRSPSNLHICHAQQSDNNQLVPSTITPPFPLPPANLAQLSTAGTTTGFQINERYLEWDDSAARRLIKIYVAQELDQTIEWVDQRLDTLSALIPDLSIKLNKLQANLVLQLAKDPDAVAHRLLSLKQRLPGADLATMLWSCPWLFSKPSLEEIDGQLERLNNRLKGVRIDVLVETEPAVLLCDIDKVLGDIRRLLPGEDDPVMVFVSAPGAHLDMATLGLPASLLIDDGIPAA